MQSSCCWNFLNRNCDVWKKKAVHAKMLCITEITHKMDCVADAWPARSTSSRTRGTCFLRVFNLFFFWAASNLMRKPRRTHARPAKRILAEYKYQNIRMWNILENVNGWENTHYRKTSIIMRQSKWSKVGRMFAKIGQRLAEIWQTLRNHVGIFYKRWQIVLKNYAETRRHASTFAQCS